MAKVVCVCPREPGRVADLERSLAGVLERLRPDNADAAPSQIVSSSGMVTGILTPSGAVRRRDSSVCLGSVASGAPWWQMGTDAPEGTHAIIRADEAHVEVVADVVASRTVWYYLDDEVFIAATSQRAIIALLRSFVPERAAVSWMLSGGNLGPTCAWDSRLTRMPVNSTLCLDRRSWKLSTHGVPLVFEAAARDDQAHAAALKSALEEAFGRLRLDYAHWVLPLSGGFDSRAMLCLLPDTTGLRTITWGTASALTRPDTDASVARALAEAMNVAHHYHALDACDEEPTRVVQRFLQCGEGRVDHIDGYTDGFALWTALREQGVEGIIRGDEGFGWTPVSSERKVRSSIALTRCADVADLDDWQRIGLAEQVIPEALLRRRGESLATWRDRLYLGFRLPVVLAGLTDLKSPYVEVVCPLLSRGILQAVTTIPDHLRTDKQLFRSLVTSICPPIPFAEHPATDSSRAILRTPTMAEAMSDELLSSSTETLFSREFARLLVQRLHSQPQASGSQQRVPLRARILSRLPGPIREWARDRGRSVIKPTLDPSDLAFRAYIACRMHAILAADAKSAGPSTAS
jgi:hypothetical protein